VVVVAAGEPEVVDDGLEALRAPPDEAGVAVGDVDEGVDVDDGLEGLRAPPGVDPVWDEVFCVDVFGVGVPDVGRVVSAIKSSANPTGKPSRKPCVKNNRDHSRFHRRWTGQVRVAPLLPASNMMLAFPPPS